MSSLAIDKVTKRYGAYPVIPELSLTVEEGEFCVLVGPSGCGKSTLLRIIAGLEPVSSGRVLIDGVDMSGAEPPERGVAMVFQSYALYPHMTVARNIGFGLEIARTPRRTIGERVAAAAAKLHLDSLLQRRPRELSGGQRQRVAIGRAITRKPRLFLLDEPLSNLDAALRVNMRAEIARLKAELASTMIYVTHDQVEAMTLADRIVVMNRGHIEQVGAPLELYDRPANKFVAGFIGSPAMNFLPAKVQEVEDGKARVVLEGGPSCDFMLAAPLAPDTPVEVGVRPEHLRLAEPGEEEGLTGEAVLIERLGSDTFCHMRTGGRTIVFRDQAARTLRAGEAVTVQAQPGALHLFDGDGRRVSR